MFLIDDFMQRYIGSLHREVRHWVAPPNGFDDKPVTVNINEFYDLCLQDPDIYFTQKVHGILMKII